MPPRVFNESSLLPTALLHVQYAVSPEGSVHRRFFVTTQSLYGGYVTLFIWDSDSIRTPTWKDDVPKNQKAFLKEYVNQAADDLWSLAPRLVRRILADPAGALLDASHVSVDLNAVLLQESDSPGFAWTQEAELLVESSVFSGLGGLFVRVQDGSAEAKLVPGPEPAILQPKVSGKVELLALVNRVLTQETGATNLLLGLPSRLNY